MNWLQQKLSVAEQQSLLNDCIVHNIPLHQEFHRRGLTYEHLRYINYDDNRHHNAHMYNEFLNDVIKPPHAIPTVSFFPVLVV